MERTRTNSGLLRAVGVAVAGLSAVAMVAAGCGGGSNGGQADDGGGSGGGLAGASDVVATSSGPVRGTAVDGGVTAFLGLPYAAPPVDDLRWRAPQPPANWDAVRDASEPARPCLQGGPDDGGLGEQSDEDCLAVNVYVPSAGAGPGAGAATVAAPSGLPVMFWVHGGGFVGGSAVDVDPAELAAGGPVLVVSANYRLGPLGYLAHPALAAEADGDTGAYAIQDLTAALRWVEENAASFGGDPDNVTVFGESAGSMNVCALLGSPPAAGLFQRAITQSGPCTWYFPSMETAFEIGEGVAQRLGCTEGDDAAVAACLRSRQARQVLGVGGAQANIFSTHPWTPAVGSATQPLRLPDAVRQGEVPQIPMMVGTVRDEGRGFTGEWARSGPIDEARYVQIVQQYFPDRANAVLASYPPGSVQPRELLAQVITDAVFTCATNVTADLFAGSGVPVYSYEFDVPDQRPITDDVAFGASHAWELRYLFPGPNADGSNDLTTDERRALSDLVIGYWTRFAATGDPNEPTGTAPDWPRWDASGERQKLALYAGGVSVTDDGAAAHHCDVWR